MSNAIVMMSAIIPTVGHKYLIDFAKQLVIPSNGSVFVLLGTMDSEPVCPSERYDSFVETYAHDSQVKIILMHRDMPQQPDQHPDFWNLWKTVVLEYVTVQPDDYFVASELYGIDMANQLGCHFVPCNRYREVFPIKGTTVRHNLQRDFRFILPAFQKNIRKTVTLFGAESCGKTTMGKRLAKDLNGWFIPEWAREYLETVGPEVTDAKMDMIVKGQYASQQTAHNTLFDKPFIFQDTDLLSTIGYYRLYGRDKRVDINAVHRLHRQTSPSDLYLVMSDQIPMEPDQLRYGGTVRETTSQFWIDLLEEFGCNYGVVPYNTHDKQTEWITNYLTNWFEITTEYIWSFER